MSALQPSESSKNSPPPSLKQRLNILEVDIRQEILHLRLRALLDGLGQLDLGVLVELFELLFSGKTSPLDGPLKTVGFGWATYVGLPRGFDRWYLSRMCSRGRVRGGK